MTALQGSLINVEEATALVESQLVSTDPRRTAWEAASEADQAIFCRRATADLAACNWEGRPTTTGQGLPFPRVLANGLAVGGSEGTSPAVPPGAAFSVWSVPGCPGEVYAATALQAAALALRALGHDDAAGIAADAQRGVAGRSSPGGSSSIDLARASSPRARLDPDAWAVMEPLFSWGGDVA